MSRGNVIAAHLYWPHLTHRQMRLFTRMAAVSLDPPGFENAPPYLYWEPWQMQAASMGWDGVKEINLERMVRRVRAELSAAGAIRVYAPARKGRSITWQVLVDPSERADRSGPPLPGP